MHVVVDRFDFIAGILLHYDDPNQDLQDLYFIDPKWLCELMARIVTLPQVNPYVMNGVLNLDNLPLLLRGEQFAHDNSPQFIRLLNRFQIACSLDDNRVLIPSKLPVDKPEEAINDDLPFITLKRIHSLPCIPHGFWSRLISRLLFYMKDMLSGGEIFTRKEYSSPFQLDPFCCRCPLVLENLSSGGFVEGDPELLGTGEPSMGGSLENLFESSSDFQGFRYYGTPRQGTFINGRFFRSSDSEGNLSCRSDSGYEYSSEDDDDAGGGSHPSHSETFPFRRSRDDPWQSKGMFKHGTDPGVRRKDQGCEVENRTPNSDSAFANMVHNFRQEEVPLDSSRPSLGDESSVTVTSEQRIPIAKQGASLSGNESQDINSTQEIAAMQDLSGGTETIVSAGAEDVSVDDDVVSEFQITCSSHASFESSPKSINGCPINITTQYGGNSDESGSVPYQSATSRSCTSDPFVRAPNDGQERDSSSATPPEDLEISCHFEGLHVDGLPRLQQCWAETEAGELSRDYSADHTPGSFSSVSMSSDKESSGEGFRTSESRPSSVHDTPDTTVEDVAGNIQSRTPS